MGELRSYAATLTEVSRRFAAWLGVHHTDGAALLEIVEAEEHGAPLSPTRLGERVSLTSGATTALINRLERARHVVRTRDDADRRAVTLHTTAEVAELADEYFGALSGRLDELMRRYSPAQLRQFEAFLVEVRSTLEQHLDEQPKAHHTDR